MNPVWPALQVPSDAALISGLVAANATLVELAAPQARIHTRSRFVAILGRSSVKVTGEPLTLIVTDVGRLTAVAGLA